MSYKDEIYLPRTEAAFAELASSNKFGYGEHIDYHLTSGDLAIELGSEEFDPAYHDIEDIDPSLEDGIALGGLYVASGLSARPLMVNILHDASMRAEDPRLTRLKQNGAERISSSLVGALPQTDPVQGTVITNLEVRSLDLHDVIRVADRSGTATTIKKLALDGLSVVISDFQAMKFDSGSLRDVLAVKVNHLIERQVPTGIGIVQLGGGAELNTSKAAHVNTYNTHLEIAHEAIIGELEAAGAHVVSVVVDPRIKPYGVDVTDVDSKIARSVEQLAS